MQFRVITRFIAILVIFLGISMAGPLLVSLIYDDSSTRALLFSMLITSLIGITLFFCTKKQDDTHLNHRDGVTVVTLGWVMAGLFGTLPYLFSGAIPDFTNAYFESISGFTTTGASILTDIERLPKGILLWRSQTQWLGGMGIIVLSIAILPFLGVGGMQLYRAEIPSPVLDKLKPRISETAKTLWKVYLLITVVEIMMLFVGGMPLFDSVCHGFCTMPTGGFSTKNASIAYFNSPYFDSVFILFMLFAGINFSLHYKLIKGDLRIFGKDPECRVFLFLLALFTLIVTLNTYGSVYESLTNAFRAAAFQVTSILIPADSFRLHVFRRHGRINWRRHENNAHHAANQARLSGNIPYYPSPCRHHGQTWGQIRPGRYPRQYLGFFYTVYRSFHHCHPDHGILRAGYDLFLSLRCRLHRKYRSRSGNSGAGQELSFGPCIRKMDFDILYAFGKIRDLHCNCLAGS